ncbi:MAG TPA: hypothetical protein VF398_06700 [bacterium]|jgi:hypothetical protein
MEARIKDLTVGELRLLISETVKHAVEDLLEDALALGSKNYLKSIEQARKDYRGGRVKELKDVLDV